LERDVEWVARLKLKELAKQADLAVVLIDASVGVTDLDAAIAGMAVDFGLSIVVALNKWDKMKGEDAEDRFSKLERTSDLKLDFLQWCPIVRISGLTGKGTAELLKTIDRVLEARQQRVQTSRLNRVFEQKLRLHAHPLGPRGKPAKFYYLSQISSDPPEFVLFSNIPGSAVHFSYRRFITNTLRQEFGFNGTPIRLHFKVTQGH
jgi:GTP-binding protein